MEKGEVIPSSAAKKSPPVFVENYYLTQYKFGDPTDSRKNLSQKMGFVTRFLNGASKEIKVKLNESRLLKFYQINQVKENSSENSAEKNFQEDSQLDEL